VSIRPTMPTFIVFVVEDNEPFRRFLCSLLERRSEFKIIQASDGLEAVRKAEECQPDLILLDIGLPKLNGIEVAKQARRFAPHARLLFVSQESSSDVVEEAFRVGARGYVHKQHTQRDLLPAIETVLAGKKFVSRGFESSDSTDVEAPHIHEILFCSNETVALEGLTRFIADALNTGNAAIVWATESRRASLLQRLRAHRVDIDAAIRRGTYVASDVSEPADPIRIHEAIKGLSEAASKAGKERPRVAVCGERAGRLWAEGKTEAAIRLEQLLNEMAKYCDIDIFCTYPLLDTLEGDHAFKSVCAEHTRVYSQ